MPDKNVTNQPARFTFSLIQTVSSIFCVILLLVVFLSMVSIKGVERVGGYFDTLSEQVLPLALNNAKLTQNVLEQVKLLGYSTQSSDLTQLNSTKSSIQTLSDNSNAMLQELLLITKHFPEAISPQEKEQLLSDMTQLQAMTSLVLTMQIDIQAIQSVINKQVEPFRYGVSSAGPEMSRISSFLAEGNPESTDAANRFVSSVSAMESSFLMLMMHEEMDKAESEYRQLRNRLAGMNLAYDDFSEWHPDVKDFTSLVAAYQMVSDGFEEQGIIKNILARLALVEEQKQELAQVMATANRVIISLNTLSEEASNLIDESESVVNSTISNIDRVLIISGTVITMIILISGFVLQRWVNKGLKNIKQHLALLAEHDFSKKSEPKGPYELQVITSKLNIVVESTAESVVLVTRNCETLYQTAEVSHDAAEQTNQSLNAQNESLQNMITTITN